MGKKNIENEIAEIQEEAQEDFDLVEHIMHGTRREKTVTVFTDEESGDLLGGDEPIIQNGIDTGERRRWGLRGELAEIKDQAVYLESLPEDVRDPKDVEVIQKEAERLIGEIAPLLERLSESGITVVMRSVPPVVHKVEDRAARKHLGIKKGAISDDVAEDLNIEKTARLLAASVVKVKMHSTGATKHSLRVEEARAMMGYLPPSEFYKLDVALGELQFQRAIATAGVESPDF